MFGFDEMRQNRLHVLPISRARAEREATRRAELVRRRERLMAAIESACSQSTLSEEQIAMALSIVQRRRAQREAEETARRRWPIVTGRAWGEL